MDRRMSGISTHVLDQTLGAPAAGVRVRLEREESGIWRELCAGETDADGRIRSVLPTESKLEPGRFRLGFETGAYFRAHGGDCFHPYVEIVFDVTDVSRSYHVPLLITPYSYSTYRGS
jgi:5-hydroxyisourate hydrolase